MITIKKESACAVTGHRVLGADFNSERLKNAFVELINKGVDTFLIGMAVGFDSKCFLVLEQLKNEYSIKLIACIPCANQDKSFTLAQKKEYARMLEVADQKIMVGVEYTSGCMLKRNRFMVDNADYLVCYLREQKGGTAYTVNYAKSKNKNIIEV